MKNNNNDVFLLVGPQGSGKTQFSSAVVARQPEVRVICRDEILIRRFGSAYGDGFSGVHQYAYLLMMRLLRRTLATGTGLKVILDCWTGDSRERKSIIADIRNHGARRVIAAYFITPVEVVEQWFWKKPGIAKAKDWKANRAAGEKKIVYFSEDAPRRDHELFHELASNIESDGFDWVVRVDPRDEVMELV